jgi:hypothetical protein
MLMSTTVANVAFAWASMRKEGPRVYTLQFQYIKVQMEGDMRRDEYPGKSRLGIPT